MSTSNDISTSQFSTQSSANQTVSNKSTSFKSKASVSIASDSNASDSKATGSALTKSAPTQSSSLTDWIYYMQQIHVTAIDMGLSRVLPVAEKLGLIKSAKDDAYVITVAGTNGKGSTTAIISAACEQAGYKTALYQSPHLIDFNERVRINGEPVGDQVLIDAFVAVEQARLACELTLSFFEMTTLAAMLIFAQADCDVWVLEVGLGGRLDVVNIIDPDLAVITNVGIDHVDWLGDTREKIGYEKAGILRNGIPLVYGEKDIPNSVLDKAEACNSVLYQFSKDYQYSEQENSWQFSSAYVTLELPKPNLSLFNSANAIAALLASKLNITANHIKSALTDVRLAGRFDARVIADRNWLFDVAHNERGMSFLLSQFIPLWRQHYSKHANASLHLVFSMLADKDIEQVVELLTNANDEHAKLGTENLEDKKLEDKKLEDKKLNIDIDAWHIAEINHPRAASISKLSKVLADFNQNNINSYDSLADAAQGVIQTTQLDDLILVCGSFHTIGEVLNSLND